MEAELVSRRDPLAVRLGESDQHLGEPRGHVLAGETQHALPQLTDALVQGADHVDGQRRARLEQGAEIAALDAPHLALAGGHGQLLHQRALGTEHFPEQVARLEDGEHRAALALPLPQQPHASRAQQVDLVGRQAWPVDDRSVAEGFHLEVAAEIDHVGRRQAGRGEGLELRLEAGVGSQGTHGVAPGEEGVARLSEHQACQLVSTHKTLCFQ